jgi:hypothetical protein
MSIVFHHYKTLKEENKTISGIEDLRLDINDKSIALKKELDKWKSYYDILCKPNRDLFKEMLQSVNRYSNAIESKGDDYVTEPLLISLIFDQYKKLMNNIS